MANNRPSFSIPSILAVICAVVSFRVGFVGGMILAIAAVLLGVLGLLLSLLPGKRGGIVSFISIAAGLIGIVAAVVRLVAQ